MSRGRAFNIWKSKSKYISRLKKNMYYWKVVDGETYNRFGVKVPLWRKAVNWMELDQGNKHAKKYKKTTTFYRDYWKQFEKRCENKKIRNQGKMTIINYNENEETV